MNDKKNIIILTLLFALFSIIFFAKTGNILIDFSRESYIPYQINNGEKLIKDIFLIYGPFGYIINSLLYKISSNINILIVAAHLISCFIVILFYLIARKFSEEKTSFIFSVFFIAISIFSNSTFSFVLPYSYSTLWAILGAYLVLFSLLYKKQIILYLALGLILSNKTEFFVPLFITSITFLIYKKNFQAKNMLYMVFFPLFSYGYLYLASISKNDLINNFFYIKQMLSTKALNYLYKGMGAYFEIEYFKYNIINLTKLTAVFAIALFLFNKKREKLSYIIFLIPLLFLNTNTAFNLLLLPIIILLFYMTYKKNISSELLLLIFISLILCSKSIFAINPLSYSNFGYMLAIFSTYLLASKIINKNWLLNVIIIYLAITFTANLGHYLINKKEKLKTNIGKIWINNYNFANFKQTNEFIKKNIKNNESLIVIPEGQILNLINNKPHQFYNSTFTPLDFETFKDETLIQKLAKNKTDYIIFFPRNTIDYGKKEICKDYAVDFCKYIMDNYTKIQSFGEKSEVNIYKIKKK